MLDYTSQYFSYDIYAKREFARQLLDSNAGILHVVISYKDSLREDIPVFLVFDNQDEWWAWVELYQSLGGYVEAYHTPHGIY